MAEMMNEKRGLWGVWIGEGVGVKTICMKCQSLFCD